MQSNNIQQSTALQAWLSLTKQIILCPHKCQIQEEASTVLLQTTNHLRALLTLCFLHFPGHKEMSKSAEKGIHSSIIKLLFACCSCFFLVFF